MHKLAVGLIAVGLVSSSPIHAADTRIPISGPVVISQSGNYVVTNDFAAPVGTNAFKFVGDVVVDIDLNGHTISGSIPVHHFLDPAPQCVSLNLRHGRLAHATLVASSNLGHLCAGSRPRPIAVLDGVTLEDVEVNVSDTLLTITSSEIIDSALESVGDWSPGLLKVTNNWLTRSVVRIRGGKGQVYGNVFEQGSIEAQGSGSDGTGLIGGNTLIDADLVFSDVNGGSDSFRIVKNHVEGSFFLSGIKNSTISGNEIGGCTTRNSEILISGFSRRNVIDDNVFLGDCTHGIVFGPTTFDNTYSGNVFRVVVPEPILDEGTRNGPGRLDVAPQ